MRNFFSSTFQSSSLLGIRHLLKGLRPADKSHSPRRACFHTKSFFRQPLLPILRRVAVALLHFLTWHNPPISRSDANAGIRCTQKLLPYAQAVSRSEASHVSSSRRNESPETSSRDNSTPVFGRHILVGSDSNGPTFVEHASCSYDTAFLALFEGITRLRKSILIFLNFGS